jgi:inner membrane protein
MDNLTHTLIGVGAANAGLSRKFGRGTLMTLILASNIPDVDFIWSLLGGPEAFLSRRMFTHSLVGAPIVTAALAGVMRLFYRDASWKNLWLLALVGAGLHVFFDLVNSYGVVILYPFTTRRFELAWIFIIDLAIWAVLLGPFLFYILRSVRSSPERIWRAALAVLAAYVLLCGTGRELSARRLRDLAQQQEGKPEFTYVFPEALGPHRFRGVWRAGNEYSVFLIRPWTGEIAFQETVRTDAGKPEVEAVRSRSFARKLEWFFKAPVWTLDGETAEVFDLRFRSIVLKWRESPFKYRFPVSENG